MEFHISRRARDRYGVDDLLFSYTGNVLFANLAASRELAYRVNQVRGADAAPGEVMHAAALFAMGLIDELSHALIANYRQTLDPDVLPAALQWLEAQANQVGVEKLLTAFTSQFPNVGVYRGEQTVDEWLDGSTDGMSHREAAFEELVLLWLANSNPAFAPFREFFNDAELAQQTIYGTVTANLGDYFATRPQVPPGVDTLLDALRAPILASPDSLTGQLAFIREQWAEQLGEEMRQVLLALDVLKEEEVAIWMRFHPPMDSAAAAALRRGRGQGQEWSSEGFEGDEFMGFAQAEAERVRRLQSQSQPVVIEYEAFSPDQAWMPTVVLIAKSTYVWLEQLSKKYQRHIHRLDQIPDEELGLIADRGLNGLWLIGLWERSTASQTIKRLRGQADAVASAYSVADYRIAGDLGGEDAYRVLRDSAAAKGIRLASDMVPNHMGIDSTWVMEHPEWFISRPESPFPSYSFEGPDLSHDSRYEIKIDDHYYDQTDAAVVFRLRDRSNGHDQFIYHGNDGTTFAWNDTAQLDYSKAYVREQVMQTILAVARLFPIIRFDAAMTLAKKHVQRLWFPLHGAGGSIPSRAESSMTNEEFDALMPHEFWREVVDRVAVEVPGTLLLAEAFWLLEGYFVRTLGMHRVYNSAFMNMLRDEENAKYRSYLKKTIEFDPDILKRYVNFMSNPDERTAIDQFGTGDRYFGVATLLATIPGLPMFGHGQVEAFTEKYGMEYKTAKFDESPNEDLVARHQREIAPLLKNRRLYAESTNFVLYDYWTPEGTVDENVFAYSNRLGEERAIILFNNRYGGTRGTIHVSAESMDKASGNLRTRRLSEALHLPSDDDLIVAYKDTVTDLEYLRRSRSLDYDGLTLDLRAYQYVVLQNWHAMRSTAEYPWGTLCDALHGAGVYNLDDALAKLRLRPLHDALLRLLNAELLKVFTDPAPEPVVEGVSRELGEIVEAEAVSALPELEAAVPTGETVSPVAPFLERAGTFLAIAHGFLGGRPEFKLEELQWAVEGAADMHASLPPLSVSGLDPFAPAFWAQAMSCTVLRHLAADSILAAAAFDELHLRAALAEVFSTLGLSGEDTWRAAARVRVLLRHGNGAPPTSVDKILSGKSFWNDPDVRWLANLSEFEGKVFLNRECLLELSAWLLVSSLMHRSAYSSPQPSIEPQPRGLDEIAAVAEKAGYDLDRFMAVLGAPKTLAAESAAPLAKMPTAPTKGTREEVSAPEDSPVDAPKAIADDVTESAEILS